MTKKKTAATDSADSDSDAKEAAAKAADASKETAGPTDDTIVKIERGPWEIDRSADDLNVQDFGNSVHVTANGTTYTLTRDEAAPFLPDDEGIAQSK